MDLTLASSRTRPVKQPGLPAVSAAPLTGMPACRYLWPFLLFATWFALTLTSNSAAAGPVVVGSVNPDTKQVTVFQDLLVKKFIDGTPISHVYGKLDAVNQRYILVRAGKSAAGECQTEAFRLVRLSGNRLALADLDWKAIPWGGLRSVPTLKKCYSVTCAGSCEVVGDPNSTNLDDYLCPCSSGGTSACKATMDIEIKLEDVVIQGPGI